MPLEGLSKRLKMHKNLKWIIHNFHFILSKHKSYTFKWRYETKDLIFVFKIHYLYIKLGLICIETEWNGLNKIPVLLVLCNLKYSVETIHLSLVCLKVWKGKGFSLQNWDKTGWSTSFNIFHFLYAKWSPLWYF